MSEDHLSGIRIPRKKHPRPGRGRGKPWKGPTETEKRAALRLGFPPLKPVKPGKR
jgi:hypothetical protein